MLERVKEVEEEGAGTGVMVRLVELGVQERAARRERGVHVGVAEKDMAEGRVRKR